MTTLETIPPEVHSKIFSYLSTATSSPTPYSTIIRGIHDTSWNEIGHHPLRQLGLTSKPLRTAVEAYCKHRLQHLLTVRPPGKGPQKPSSVPDSVYYLQYMARHCTFCYERVAPDSWGAVDFTIPVCEQCKDKFPSSRMIRWERVEQEYDLSLGELLANCTWAPVARDLWAVMFNPDAASGDAIKTYVFDERDIQRYIKRRYGDLDGFLSIIEKKRWNKELELKRMAKQRRWARKEFERRIAEAAPMVERFIAQQEEIENKRAEERQRILEELEARTERREEMFRGWLATFRDESAGPEGRCNQLGEAERYEEAADSIVSELLAPELRMQHRFNTEEEIARLGNWPIYLFRQHMEEQVTADVLLKYGLDSLVEPEEPEY